MWPHESLAHRDRPGPVLVVTARKYRRASRGSRHRRAYRRALVTRRDRFRVWLNQFRCGMVGHLPMVKREPDRLSMACAYCDKALSPGWTLAPKKRDASWLRVNLRVVRKVA